MGQTLSSPATQKRSESDQSRQFVYGVSEMQGWRITMEDAHTAILNLHPDKPEINTFFAVYDGHGGSAAAKFAAKRVHQRLVIDDAFHQKQWGLAMKNAFLHTDSEMRSDPMHQRDPSGCTAVAALVTSDKKIVVANAGDSRAVLSVKGEVKPLSYDHKPQSDTEKARISAAGGYVEYGRVNGNLALSRALGDFEYKKNNSLPPEAQIITADPEIIEHPLSDEDEFIVIACDGIWDCLTSQQVVDIVRRQVAEGKELTEICELLCDHCLAPDTTSGAGIGCDNMTVLIVALLNGRTKQEWRQWIVDRVQQKYGYDTPTELPQIFSMSRLMAFRARRQAQDERDGRGSGGGMDSGLGGVSSLLSSGALGGFARVLGSNGGISFHPGSGIISDTGTLMFDKYDDSDEDDSDEEMAESEGVNGNIFRDPFGTGSDRNKSLTEQLAELDDEEMEEIETSGITSDLPSVPRGATISSSSDPSPEKPPGDGPPSSSGHGVDKPSQLVSDPLGDLASPAVKAEGLFDKSEDPLKA